MGPSESGGMLTDKDVQMYTIKEVISRAIVIAAVAVATTSAVRESNWQFGLTRKRRFTGLLFDFISKPFERRL